MNPLSGGSAREERHMKRKNDISTGMGRLARTLKTATRLPVSQACDTLLATLAPRPADDIAILTLKYERDRGNSSTGEIRV